MPCHKLWKRFKNPEKEPALRKPEVICYAAQRVLGALSQDQNAVSHDPDERLTRVANATALFDMAMQQVAPMETTRRLKQDIDDLAEEGLTSEAYLFKTFADVDAAILKQDDYFAKHNQNRSQKQM